jgi:hypothetical protein
MQRSSEENRTTPEPEDLGKAGVTERVCSSVHFTYGIWMTL